MASVMEFIGYSLEKRTRLDSGILRLLKNDD